MEFGISLPGRPGARGRALLSATACLALTAGVLTAAGSGPAFASGAASGFTAGDVVVYRVGDGSTTLSGSGAPVFLDEYSPSGTLVSSVALPTASAAPDNAIVASGSATSEGGLTLSADGRYLVATGYDAALGASGLSSSAAASVPRTIARVDAAGDVDTTTALTDFSDGNNPRSAVSADGSGFWVGGAAGGVRYAALGATTSTPLVSSTYKNVRQLEIFGGQLYTSADPSKASVTVATVGTGLPTSGTSAVTNLPFGSAPVEPYAYSLLTLGSGSAPDTLYVADNSVGAVVKYGLVGGSWTEEGSVPVPGVTGVTADDADGTVTVYATTSGSAGTSGTLYGITDPSGLGGTLAGTASVLAAAPPNEAFRGVAFAPGTVIGSGGGSGPAKPAPTISTQYSGLPATQGDPTNPTLAVTVGATDFTANQLTVSAASSDASVAPLSGISLSGTGADRTLTVTPGSVGYSTITLTATAPDGTSATTQIQYGVSANLGDPTQRYYSGAGNASSAIDVGDGYMIVGDDESNILRLYNETQSGPPVKTFDFTGQLPFGSAEIDIESSARAGDMLYWTGSMSNNTSGAVEPSRSTLFAARITGSGADTQLTYVGSYTGLQDDLVSWDEDNGSGLGANYFGFADSVASGVDGHGDDALNVEGMEFAPGSSTTAYLAFRAPLEPTSDRHLALVLPLTDIDQLVADGNPGTVHATFGAPILMNLGGLGLREIRADADGQYLISAGTADGSNSSFVLYSWDGVPADPPLPTGTALPLEPAGGNQGSWETIVSVPDPLVAGAPVELVQDDGDTAWYGDTATSKDTLAPALQKDLGQTFAYEPGALLATSTAVTAQPTAPVAGQPVTYTAVASGPAGTLGTPTGAVDFQNGGVDIAGCSAQPLDATGAATCTTVYPAAGAQSVAALYGGDPSFAASASAEDTLTVGPDATAITVTSSANPAPYNAPVTLRAQVAPAAPGSGTPTGPVVFSVVSGGRSRTLSCGTSGAVALISGAATCTVNTQSFAVPGGTYQVTASYAGDGDFLAGSGTLSQQVALIPSSTKLSVTPSSPVQGQPVLITVGIDEPGTVLPLLSGSVTVTVTSASGAPVPATCVLIPGLGGVCAIVPGKLSAAQGPYTVTARFAGNGVYAPSTASTTFTVAAATHR
jgi:Bacterial Ig-like domain (group 3)